MANVNFVVAWSSLVSISPASAGDGTSLLTVADTFENESFNADSTTGRTRVFYDPETGAIVEADISINPHPRSAEGADLQFSSDGTPGTYDLEATFTHEVGHLLGLDHSAVLAATMQGHQAVNGTYGLPAFTQRTLSEDDRQRVRSLYGPTQHLGRIEGRLLDRQNPNTLYPSQSFTVWAENLATGRVVASDSSANDGTYRLEGLPVGQYRVLAMPREVDPSDSGAPTTSSPAPRKKVRSYEIANQVVVKADTATPLNYNLIPQPGTPSLDAGWIGLGGELSAVAVPVEPGKKIKIYLGGDGVDQVPGTNIVVTSSFFTVDPSSLSREQLSTPFPVISFDLSVAANAPFGDFTLRLQSNSGETIYIPGALTIDPGVTYAAPNPIDEAKFFVTQHYADLAGREPDRASVDRFTAQLNQCGTRADCLRNRLDLSTTLFVQNELQSHGLFVDGLYLAGLGRRPRLAEFESDRNALGSSAANTDNLQSELALAFVQRPEFERKFPTSMKASEFVDAFIASAAHNLGVDLLAERKSFVKLFDGTNVGRAAILTRAVSLPAFVDAHYNQAFVQAEYFGYLRRDPDETGLNFWVNVLNSKPLRHPDSARSLICAFLNSSEYQLRFGLIATHNRDECGN